VTLESSDPFAAPVINPNLLGTELDAQLMVHGLQSARRFVEASPAFDGYVIGQFGDGFANATTDAEVLAFARAESGTVSTRLFFSAPCADGGERFRYGTRWARAR
jgi:choline dehydrogenase-like flavoprotein